jgi:protein SCO1/2
MNSMRAYEGFRRQLIVALAVIALAAPVARAQYYGKMSRERNEPQPPPTEVINNVTIEQKLDAQIPLDLPFRDENGRSVTLGEYFDGKPVILSLAYYECPMLCNQVLNGLLQSMRLLDFTLGKDYRVLTVSINPHEKAGMAAQKRKNYLGRYRREGAGEDWHFLTGDSAAIARLADVVGFRYVYDPKSGQYAHASGIMLATPEGRLARYMYGIEFQPKELKLGLMEAAKGEIGSLVNKVVYLCYEYDPMSGKYGFAITRILQGAGVATVLVLGGFMTVWLRRERRRGEGVSGKG